MGEKRSLIAIAEHWKNKNETENNHFDLVIQWYKIN